LGREPLSQLPCPPSDPMTATPGSYQLRIAVHAQARIPIGAFGVCQFPAGKYVYTGSALNGLEARVARHLRSEKKLHWHIDYLLQHAEVTGVDLFPGSGRRECQLNQSALSLPGAKIIVPGFGSSDCRCVSHLVYLGPA